VEGERRRRRLRRSQPPATDADPATPDRRAPTGRGPLDMPSRAARPDDRHTRPDRPDDRHTRPDRPDDRAGRPDDPVREPYAETAEVHDPEPEPARPATSAEEREAERGLRGLVGSGTSQVRTGAALRARDAARPTDADIAAAEEQLVIVRRNWVPRDDLPRGR